MVNTFMSVGNMLVTPAPLKTVYEYKIKVHLLVFNSFYAGKMLLKLNSQIKCGL